MKVAKAESDKNSPIDRSDMKTRESGEKNRHKQKPINTGRVLKEAGNLGQINQGKGIDSTTIPKAKCSKSGAKQANRLKQAGLT